MTKEYITINISNYDWTAHSAIISKLKPLILSCDWKYGQSSVVQGHISDKKKNRLFRERFVISLDRELKLAYIGFSPRKGHSKNSTADSIFLDMVRNDFAAALLKSFILDENFNSKEVTIDERIAPIMNRYSTRPSIQLILNFINRQPDSGGVLKRINSIIDSGKPTNIISLYLNGFLEQNQHDIFLISDDMFEEVFGCTPSKMLDAAINVCPMITHSDYNHRPKFNNATQLMYINGKLIYGAEHLTMADIGMSELVHTLYNIDNNEVGEFVTSLKVSNKEIQSEFIFILNVKLENDEIMLGNVVEITVKRDKSNDVKPTIKLYDAIFTNNNLILKDK